MMSCKRKRSKNEVVKDSGDADLTASTADELYSDYSAMNSPHKKRKVNDTSRFHQNGDDCSYGTDDVQVFGNHNSSDFHTGSNITEQGDCARIALASDEQQSSNFEDLLFGLLSGNDCSLVISQKCDTASVEGTKERVHKAEIRRSVSDTSSDCSDADISQVASSQRSAEATARLDGTSCFLSKTVTSNCNNPSAAVSEFNIASDHSVSVKTDLLPSTSKHKKKKSKKLTEDCATLYSESECHEKKPKQTKQHTFTCVSPSRTSDNSQYALLRKVHRTVNVHEAGCDKMSTQATTDTFNRLELNVSSIENVSSGKTSYRDKPKSSKKHKKERKNKEVTKDCTEFESSQSIQNRKKKHHKHIDNMCSSSDSITAVGFSVSHEKDSSHERSTVACENMPVRKKSEAGEFEQLLLNVLVTDKVPAVAHSLHEKNNSEDRAISSKERGRECDLSDSTSDEDFDDLLACSVAKQCTSVNTQPSTLQTDSPGHKLALCTSESKNRIEPVKCKSQMKKSRNCSTCSSEGSPSLLDSTLLPTSHCAMQTPVHSKEVNDIHRSTPTLTDRIVTRDKEVSRMMLFSFRTQFYSMLAL